MSEVNTIVGHRKHRGFGEFVLKSDHAAALAERDEKIRALEADIETLSGLVKMYRRDIDILTDSSTALRAEVERLRGRICTCDQESGDHDEGCLVWLDAENTALRARLSKLEAFAHRVEAWEYDIQGDCVAQAQTDAKAALEVKP